MNQDLPFDFSKFQLPKIEGRTIRWIVIGIHHFHPGIFIVFHGEPGRGRGDPPIREIHADGESGYEL